MNKEQFIDYIYNNIDKVESTDNIIFFINSKNIPYSENKNGIFINISLLDDEIINELFNLITLDLDKGIDTIVTLDKEKKEEVTPNILPVESFKYKDIKLNSLQTNLLAYSK
tara:strand:- start:422 stop:757 length:336 start_codon:yes stop_codon:yes gene_type:complete